MRAAQVICALPLIMAGCSSPESRVVVYCAQDREFAEEVLADFSRQTTLAVAPKYDTEANKSVSLYEDLVREKDRPRCDVFWNNEIIATIRLQKQGLLEPYESSSARDFPPWSKAPDHTWQAFAARARVLIINTDLISEAERPRSVLDLTDPKWKGKLVMAKPQFGTTATHAACLFEVLGAEPAKDFYRALKRNAVQIVAGNKQVAEQVAAGRYAVGFTDQDDAITELLDKKPVALVFPDRNGRAEYPRLGTLFIPNTLAIVRGGPNPAGAKRLVDYLLSEGVEKRLAEGGGYQIPLNPKLKGTAHPALVTPDQVKVMDVDFEKAAALWEEVQTFLVNEIVR
jgi:iron(III) transport system substrate-binding protein